MKTLAFIFVFLSTLSIAKSQDVTPALSNYPLSVIMKVQDLASVITLTSYRQVQFANFFQKEIITAQAVSQSSLSGVQLTQVRLNVHTEFDNLLSAPELTLYSDRKKGSEYVKSTATDVPY